MSHMSMNQGADGETPAELPLLGSSSSWGHPIPGDFYRLDDDVTRSVDLGPGPLPGELLGYGSKIGPFDGYGGLDDLKYNFGHESNEVWDGKIALPEMEPEDAFSDAAQLAELELCEASVTSLVLGSCSPAEALNCMHRWLAGKAGTSITKVRPHKFALNADIFQDLSCCTQPCALKVRAFAISAPPGSKPQALVEFRRRRGDAVAFNEVFVEAAERLRVIDPAVNCPKGKMPVIGAAVATQVPLVVPTSPAEVEVADCQPLLDMMASESSPGLKAEAVAALVALANAHAAGAVTVCAALVQVQEALAGILIAAARAEVGIDVSYPAAMLFACIVRQGISEGSELERLLMAALEGIGAEGTPAMVRTELADAVCDCLRCSANSSAAFAQDLRAALAEASCKPACAPVQGRLHEALSALSVPY